MENTCERVVKCFFFAIVKRFYDIFPHKKSFCGRQGGEISMGSGGLNSAHLYSFISKIYI